MSNAQVVEVERQDIERPCNMCGEDISHMHGNAKYCTKCRKIKDRELSKESMRFSRGYYRAKKCIKCGDVIRRTKDNLKYRKSVCEKCDI